MLQGQDKIIALDRKLGVGRVEPQNDVQARGGGDSQRLARLRTVDGDRHHIVFRTFNSEFSHRRIPT